MLLAIASRRAYLVIGNINKYEYQPIVREPEVNEEDLNDVERQSVIYRPPYIKLKIDIDNVTGLPNIRLYNKS